MIETVCLYSSARSSFLYHSWKVYDIADLDEFPGSYEIPGETIATIVLQLVQTST